MISAFDIYHDLKTLDHEKKVVAAKFDKIKTLAINNYLVTVDEVIGPEGLVLFTYKPSLTTNFMTTKFKQEEPELYNKYLDIKEVRRFLLK